MALELSGHCEDSFWTRFIPQQCHHEPAIKDAIFALSALYTSTISTKTNTVNLADEHIKFALAKQSQAINSLRKTLSNGKPQLRLILIASLLFSCFEGLHGDWQTATQQVYSGLQILNRWNESHRDHTDDGLAEVALEVRLIFRRLEMQILAFLAMNPMLEHRFDDFEEGACDILDRYSAERQSFTTATDLAVAVMRHSRRAARCGNDGDSRDLLTQQQRYLQERLDRWNMVFDPIFQDACQEIVSREHLGTIELRICVWKLEIMLATSMSDSELVFDKFRSQFQRIIHYARHLLHEIQEIRGSDIPGLQYGMGMLTTLFYTATRCRDVAIRKEAIALLREWPCTNGIWHSLQAAKVAEWIASLEEDERGVVIGNCRVELQSLRVMLRDGVIEVECMQYSADAGLAARRAVLLWP